MADLVTLDVIDRPAGGVVRARRALRGAHVPGLRAVIPLLTGPFSERATPRLTPRRAGVLCAWEDGADVAAGWHRLVRPAAAGAREHWHVRAELVRASFDCPWGDWEPDTSGARPMDPGEPALVLISGDLRPRYAPAFFRDGMRTVRQAFVHAGYLGGLAVSSSAFNTTSCSCWRTYADVRDYAYREGEHLAAMKRDRAAQRHRTNWFSRLRPLAERGTLDGAAPFAGLVGEPVAA